MAWTALNALDLNQTGDYSSLPIGAAGGEIFVRIPAFPVGDSGLYRVGIYSGPQSSPGLIAEQTAHLAPFSRYLKFTVPANTPSPLLGMALVSHDDLTSSSYSLVPEWQPVEPLGQVVGGFGIQATVSLEQVVGLVSEKLSTNFAALSELASLTAGIELMLSTMVEGLRADIEALTPPSPLVPVMTGENAPSPFVVRSSHPAKALGAPFLAFDQNPNTTFLSFFGDGNAPVRLEIFLGAGKTVKSFQLTAVSGEPNNREPRIFEIQSSLDGQQWTTEKSFDKTGDNWHGETIDCTGFSISTPWIGLLIISDFGAGAPEFREMQLYGRLA